MDNNEQKEFIKYLQNKYKDLSEDKVKLLKESGLLEKDYKEFKLKKTKKAAHGSKLTFIKNLKHQCADDEELYYYKKGGRVGCGCKKKEDGGEVTKAKKGTVVDEFKAKKMQKAGKITKTSTKLEIWPTDTVHILNPKTKKMEVRDLSGKHKQFKKLTKEEYQKQSPTKKADIDSKGYKCGGSVEKFRKHLLGGSLNEIPFYLEGTPKAGIRYKGGKKDSFKNENHENVDVIMGQKPNFYTHAPVISRIISSDGNDTTFVEVPEHTSFTSIKPRVAKNNWIEDLNNKKIYNNSPEYYIMRRRFSEASLASPEKFKFFVPKPYTPLKYTFGN